MRQWRPAATQRMLQARATLYAAIRTFFAERGVLEVDTPLLARAPGTDPSLDPVTAFLAVQPGSPVETLYLQTSPEFAMKRLLAAGSGAIYQLGKAFRNQETGQRHNPEFTMLEWYRPGYSLFELMDEVEDLVAPLLASENFMRVTYAELFLEYLGLDPHDATHAELCTLVRQHIDLGELQPDHPTCLELLYSHVIEPNLKDAVLIYDYPASQAALAVIGENARGLQVAMRFELVVRGMEIANGYFELLDADEQARRFETDLALRRERGLPQVPRDDLLLEALRSGIAPCSGVALGVDRLLMLITGAASIDEVLAFPLERV